MTERVELPHEIRPMRRLLFAILVAFAGVELRFAYALVAFVGGVVRASA